MSADIVEDAESADNIWAYMQEQYGSEEDAQYALDDLVHSLKSFEASALNNLGYRQQIEFVIYKLGFEQALKEIEPLEWVSS